jgi:hypothetical protein
MDVARSVLGASPQPVQVIVKQGGLPILQRFKSTNEEIPSGFAFVLPAGRLASSIRTIGLSCKGKAKGRNVSFWLLIPATIYSPGRFSARCE